MKYCPHCGAELVDDATSCYSCGKALVAEKREQWSAIAIVAFCVSVISLFIAGLLFGEFVKMASIAVIIIGMLFLAVCLPLSVLTLVLSSISLSVTVKRNRRGKGFAIAALCMSIICCILVVSFFVLLASAYVK